VRKIWPVFKCDKLQDLVDDRDKLWNNFEQGQQKLILESEKNRRKNKPQSDSGPLRYTKSRPQHRLKMLIGKKVDTLEYGRQHLPEMEQSILEKREALRGESPVAAFVEFSSQAAAQEAFQLFGKDKKMQFSPRYIGVQPEEVIWKNLTMSQASRKIKMAIATTAIILLTIFWAIPVAFVGILTNVNYLTNKVPFLGFIDDIPSVILGVVTGLLPAVLLAVLMALVPIICKRKFSGAPCTELTF
jgi:calcium permeable stress-gated cation channel